MENKIRPIICIMACSVVAVLLLSGTARTDDTAEWWNISWHYRFPLEINMSSSDKTEWPVEFDVNFTSLFNQSASPGTFDSNSLRVLEYNSTGSIMHLIPSQFDTGDGYNATTNAAGTIIFIMNGTTTENTNRSFYVYYDTTENGNKEAPSYETKLNYSWDGQIANVNNSKLIIHIDTNRSENTSGIYRVATAFQPIISADTSERTAEYTEYASGASNLTFDARGNASFTYGPVRITVTLSGPEIEWGNVSNQTGQGWINKRYYIYNRTGAQDEGGWIKVTQEFENIGAQAINRSSGPAGAPAIDTERTFFFWSNPDVQEDNTEPSYAFAVEGNADFAGIINLNENGTSNFLAEGLAWRIGINLSKTTIQPGEKITETSAIYFGDQSGASQTEFSDEVVPGFRNPIKAEDGDPESLWASVNMTTNHPIFNHNETIVVLANATKLYDPFDLIEYVNATLDMGTQDSGDDQTIVLYDDGAHNDSSAGDEIFANTLDIADDYSIGAWNITYKLYYSDGTLLNQTKKKINITNQYNVETNVLNDFQLIGEQINATIHVTNFRNDEDITNGTSTINITCRYNDTLITSYNLSETGDGSYYFQFIAPMNIGTYYLNCSASRSNNTGWGTSYFYIEEAITNVMINITPPEYFSSNITQAGSETFKLIVIVNNTENATAQYTNITVQALPEWTVEPQIQSCGNVSIGSGCQKSFNITIPNATIPGIYMLNASVEWYNPNMTKLTNTTEFNVTVLSNPVINTSTSFIDAQVAEGYEMNAASFIVYSTGNYNLTLVTFDVDGLDDFSFEFTPQNITNLTAGDSQNVQVNITVPLLYAPGTYSGTINASGQNDGFEIININVTVPEVTSVKINTSSYSYNSSSVTQADNETISVTVNIANTGNATARYVNITLETLAGWSFAPSLHSYVRINMSDGQSAQFNLTIPHATPPGAYSVNATVEWYNPNTSVYTNATSFDVNVLSNPLINVSTNFTMLVVDDGSENSTINFTINSIGNDNISTINFTKKYLGNFTFEFIPSAINNLPAGQSKDFFINVSVPLHYKPGFYNGTINISYGGLFELMNISIKVPSSRTWTVNPEICSRSETPDVGTVCSITVNNTGNTYINFTVTPSEANHTKVNVTSFGLNKLESTKINVTYNVTGVPKIFYNSTYTINTTQNDSMPESNEFFVSLIPFIEPIISAKITPSYVAQGGYVVLSINVTDRSGEGVLNTTVNITTPDNVSYFYVPDKKSETSNGTDKIATYLFAYPNQTGNTSIRGLYNVEIFAEDNSPNHANLTENLNFSVYANMTIMLSTVNSIYYLGETGTKGTILYYVTDAMGSALDGVNVSFTLKEPGSAYPPQPMGSYQTSGGWVLPNPEFELASDAAEGTYYLNATSIFFDPLANYTFGRNTNTSFDVSSVGSGGIFADVDTQVVWYPDNTMTFLIGVYDTNYNLVEPDSMNVTVYAGNPLLGNIYLTSSLSDPRMQKLTPSNQSGRYLYVLTYQMPVTTANGDYWGIIKASKNDRSFTGKFNFQVSSGLYDVEVIPLEHEVYKEDYFDFQIILKNMGSVTQDVYLEYWVSSANNMTWYYRNLTVETEAGRDTILNRSAYIYSNQPLGMHTIYVKMTYSYVKPPITASATFEVVLKPPPGGPVIPTEPTTPPGEGPEAGGIANITITDYPSRVSLVRGWEDIRYVKVKNIGTAEADNVTLQMTGLPTPWYDIRPTISYSLQPGNETVFVITFRIPANAMVGKYTVTFLATDGFTSDEKTTELMVFRSEMELVEDELQRVRERYDSVKEETDLAQKYGKDVTDVISILDNAKSSIDKATEEFYNESYTQAMFHINAANDLITRAQDELAKTKYRPEFVTEGIPLWQILIMIAALIVANVIILLWKKKAYSKIDFRADLLKIRDIIKSTSRVTKAAAPALDVEKRKMSRVLDLLESEMKEGLISEKTYNELKKRTQKKMKEG